ncbi:MAG: helix-turn-helix domain-containing protein, partial [bacterium]
MASVGIGERLRNARTARGLTLEDIEAATRIKGHYLDALEREAWDELPGVTYVRGFLASYARQLGISVDEILSLYSVPAAGAPSATASSAVPRPVEVRITPANPQSRLRRTITAIAVVFVAGAVVLGYILVGQLRQFAATRPRPEAAAPAPSGAGSQPGASQPAGAAPGTAG